MRNGWDTLVPDLQASLASKRLCAPLLGPSCRRQRSMMPGRRAPGVGYLLCAAMPTDTYERMSLAKNAELTYAYKYMYIYIHICIHTEREIERGEKQCLIMVANMFLVSCSGI